MATVEFGKKVSQKHFASRQRYQRLSKYILPTGLKPEDGGVGLERARSLLHEGVGLVIVYPHLSKTDTYRLEELWQYQEFAERRCLTPIALHQDNLLARKTAAPTGLEFYPIVTPETVIREKNKGLPEGHGRMGFLNSSARALAEAGIILFAPTGTRMSELSMPPGRLRPTDILLNHVDMRGVPFAIFVTAFEIDGVTSYKKAAGLNLRKRYTLHTGSTFLASEILEELATFREEKRLPADPKRPFDNTDKWLYEKQFPLLVPPAYNPKGIGKT